MGVTGQERQFYHDVHRIRDALELHNLLLHKLVLIAEGQERSCIMAELNEKIAEVRP